jgi:hypothetical protein
MWINLEYLEHNQFLLNLPFVYRFFNYNTIYEINLGLARIL